MIDIILSFERAVNSEHLSAKIKHLINDSSLSDQDKFKLTDYYENCLSEAKRITDSFKSEFHKDEEEDIIAEFTKQVNFTLLAKQIDWIRCNSLANLKLVLFGEDDHFLQTKASLLSMYLDELSDFIGEKYIEEQLSFLKNLAIRSKLN